MMLGLLMHLRHQYRVRRFAVDILGIADNWESFAQYLALIAVGAQHDDAKTYRTGSELSTD